MRVSAAICIVFAILFVNSFMADRCVASPPQAADGRKGYDQEVCDTDNDGIPDSPYLCDSNDDGVKDSCDYVCDTNNDGVNDSCYVCDVNHNGFNDAGYDCDTDADGIKDSCRVCDRDGNGTFEGCEGWRYSYSYADFLDVCKGKAHTRQLTIPAPDGCGSNSGLIPIHWQDPAVGGGNSFKLCCDAHDNGYSTCHRAKSTTDEAFYTCMYNACMSAYSAGTANWVETQQCLHQAYKFYYVVRKFGRDPYRNAQMTYCLCKTCRET